MSTDNHVHKCVVQMQSSLSKVEMPAVQYFTIEQSSQKVHILASEVLSLASEENNYKKKN